MSFDRGARCGIQFSIEVTGDVRQVDQATASVALQTTQTFGRLLASEATKRAADAGLESARQDLTRAEQRRDAGRATDADVLSLVCSSPFPRRV
jgi:Outer membrane efflux protein